MPRHAARTSSTVATARLALAVVAESRALHDAGQEPASSTASTSRSLRRIANGATANPWPDRNIFSLIRSCAMATLAADGVTRAVCARKSSDGGGNVLELGGRGGREGGELLERPCVEIVCGDVAIGDAAGRALRCPDRAPRRCIPGFAPPCRTCGPVGRHRASRAMRPAESPPCRSSTSAARASRARWPFASRGTPRACAPRRRRFPR